MKWIKGKKPPEPQRKKRRRPAEPTGSREADPDAIDVVAVFEPRVAAAISYVYSYGVVPDPIAFLGDLNREPVPSSLLLTKEKLQGIQVACLAVQFDRPENPHFTGAYDDAVRLVEKVIDEIERIVQPPQPAESLRVRTDMVEVPRPQPRAIVTEQELIAAANAKITGDFDTGDLLTVIGQRKPRTYGQWGGVRPPEYAEAFDNIPMSQERLKQLYAMGHLHAEQERGLPEDVRLVGIYIELPENLEDPKKRKTIVYHRFIDSEWQALTQATRENPLIIGRGFPEKEGDPFLHLPLEDYELGQYNATGEDARIKDEHVALWVEEGQVWIRNMSTMDGVYAVAPKKQRTS